MARAVDSELGAFVFDNLYLSVPKQPQLLLPTPL